MLTRRTLVGASLAAPFIRISQAAAASSLADYYVFLGNNTGVAEDTGNGFRLQGGLYNDFASGIRLFSRFTLRDSGTIRYRLTREVIPPTVTSNGAFLNVGIVWGNDPAALPADTPTGDTATSEQWDGWRITHANKALQDSVSDRLRMTTYMPREQLNPREARVVANFQINVTYEVVLTWNREIVTIIVPTMGGKKQSWADPQLQVPASGARLMWYGSFGGQWRIENVTPPS
jgi:hypothetical protein